MVNVATACELPELVLCVNGGIYHKANESNTPNVICRDEDFLGSSRLAPCTANSSAMRELVSFLSETDEKVDDSSTKTCIIAQFPFGMIPVLVKNGRSLIKICSARGSITKSDSKAR